MFNIWICHFVHLCVCGMSVWGYTFAYLRLNILFLLIFFGLNSIGKWDGKSRTGLQGWMQTTREERKWLDLLWEGRKEWKLQRNAQWKAFEKAKEKGEEDGTKWWWRRAPERRIFRWWSELWWWQLNRKITSFLPNFFSPKLDSSLVPARIFRELGKWPQLALKLFESDSLACHSWSASPKRDAIRLGKS